VIIRLATAGSVDDGKSTLLGRLLHDSHQLPDDLLESLRSANPDLSLITDGLRAEREQKITIDVAYRYFECGVRRFILADTPGHEQYTRNMITGCSQADLVVLLVDARKGLTPQTYRHALICSLLKVPQLILVVNKMDAVNYQESVFESIAEAFSQHCQRLEMGHLICIPCSALQGDNVVLSSAHMPWYQGPTLWQYLNQIRVHPNLNVVDFRFMVQYVLRPHQDFRGLAGRICSGRIRPGQAISIHPSGLTSEVGNLFGPDGPLSEAEAGQSVVIQLRNSIDVGRGSLLARPENQPQSGRDLDVSLCWMDEQPLRTGAPYWLLHTSQRLPCHIESIRYRLNPQDLHRQVGEGLTQNQIGRAHLHCHQNLSYDPYSKNRITGSFLLVDPVTHQTVGAGLIRDSLQRPPMKQEVHVYPESGWIAPEERAERLRQRACVLWLTGLSGSGKSTLSRTLERRLFDLGYSVFCLDGDHLRHGLNQDLGFSAADRRENIRRASELARIAYQHGQIVICSFISPYACDRQQARDRIGPGDFLEIHLDCSLEECRRRDPKGLYSRADQGEVPQFTGVASPYEIPESPEMRLNTEALTPDQACEQILNLLQERLILGPAN